MNVPFSTKMTLKKWAVNSSCTLQSNQIWVPLPPTSQLLGSRYFGLYFYIIHFHLWNNALVVQIICIQMYQSYILNPLNMIFSHSLFKHTLYEQQPTYKVNYHKTLSYNYQNAHFLSWKKKITEEHKMTHLL